MAEDEGELTDEHIQEFNKIKESLSKYLDPDKLDEHQKPIKENVPMDGPLPPDLSRLDRNRFKK